MISTRLMLGALAATVALGTASCGRSKVRPVTKSDPASGTPPGEDGEGGSENSSRSGGVGDQLPVLPFEARLYDGAKLPPSEFYESYLRDLLLRTEELGDDAFGDVGRHDVFYIQFDGTEIDPDSRSGLLACDRTKDLVVAPASIAPSDQAKILEIASRYFADLEQPPLLTLDPPSYGRYSTIFVGGSSASLGCKPAPGGEPLASVFVDEGNLDPEDVGFVFVDHDRKPEALGLVVAHVLGHMLGLQHVESQGDVMGEHATLEHELAFGRSKRRGTIVVQDGLSQIAEALNGALALGSSGLAPVPGLPNVPSAWRGLPGLKELSAIGKLVGELGASDTLDLDRLEGQIAALLPHGVSVPELERVLTVLELSKRAGSGSTSSAGTTTGTKPILDSLSKVLNAAGGATGIATLASAAGFPQIGLAVSLISALTGGLIQQPTGSGAPTPDPAILDSLPDLGEILGLGEFKTRAALLRVYAGHVAVITRNYSGASREAMYSLLKVAYSQALRSL